MQRDILMDEINRLGQVMGAILARLIGKRDGAGLKSGYNFTAEALKSELDWDLAAVLALPKEEFANRYFKKGERFDYAMEQLAHLLWHSASATENMVEQKALLYRAEWILTELNSNELYSLEREQHLTILREHINKNHAPK
ncbi:hypothetical protein N8482_00465 [Chitinophagales bacterium]|nr:hypothetical protein [Chitinophagales bacterium]